MTSKAPISEEIFKAYAALLHDASEYHQDQFVVKKFQGTTQSVSVADIIAYQIGWGTLLLSWYQAGINNEQFVMPGCGFDTWDYNSIAQHFYEKYSGWPREQLLREFGSVVENIIAIVEKEYDLGNLEKCGIWQWCRLKSGKEWPLSKWVRVNTVAPYKRATKIIKIKP